MEFLEKIQKLPLTTRKIILWSIVIVIGIAFSFWRISVFRSRLSEMREGSDMVPLQYQEGTEKIKSELENIRSVLAESKEISGSIKDLSIDIIQDIIMVQEYIVENSPDPEKDLKRLEKDEEFFNIILEKAREEIDNNNLEDDNNEE